MQDIQQLRRGDLASMRRWLMRSAPRLFAVFLALHGIAHFVGVTGSLAAIEDGTSEPYLGGWWTISDPVALRTLAVLWALAGLGYVAVAIAMWIGLPWRRAALIGVTIGSLVLSVAALWAAVVGVVIDVVLLAVTFFKREAWG